MLRGKPIDEIERIMNDETWTKAVFLRDPTRRLLSSYLYLIKNKKQVSYYRDALRKATKNSSLEWDHFVRAVVDLHHQNLHWRPQASETCTANTFSYYYPVSCVYARLISVAFTSSTLSIISLEIWSCRWNMDQSCSNGLGCGRSLAGEGGR